MGLTAEQIKRLKQGNNSELGALNAIIQLINEDTEVEDILNLLTTNTGLERTPNLLRVTNSGAIASIVFSFSVYNSGAANCTVLGGVIKPGETFNFNAGGVNNYYVANSITYDATGTELVFIYNT
jgi:hypothetical protein